MNQTFVVSSLYHVYVSILLAHKYKKNGYDSLLILYVDNIPDIKNLKDSLNRLNIFSDILFIETSSIFLDYRRNIGFVNYFFNRSNALVKFFELKNKSIKKQEVFIRNSQINMFLIVRSKAYFLIKFKDCFFRMYEDGEGTYNQTIPFFRYLRRKYLIKFPILKGYDDQIKEIFVQEPHRLKDNFLKNKSKLLNLSSLENELTEIEKNNIVEEFIDFKILSPNKIKIIIITQPLSEDKLISENMKIKLYTKVVNDSKLKGFEVYFKQHPREVTNYTFGNDVINIPKLLPLEILNLSNNVKFEYGFTFFSSSLNNLKNVDNRINLGFEKLTFIDEIVDGNVDFF